MAPDPEVLAGQSTRGRTRRSRMPRGKSEPDELCAWAAKNLARPTDADARKAIENLKHRGLWDYERGRPIWEDET
jgi:hypothetical protein